MTQVVNEGQLSIIKPMLLTQWFLLKITFLNLVRGERDHDNYGITIRLNMFLLMKKKNLLLKYYKFDCRSCGNTNLKE